MRILTHEMTATGCTWYSDSLLLTDMLSRLALDDELGRGEVALPFDWDPSMHRLYTKPTTSNSPSLRGVMGTVIWQNRRRQLYTCAYTRTRYAYGRFLEEGTLHTFQCKLKTCMHSVHFVPSLLQRSGLNYWEGWDLGKTLHVCTYSAKVHVVYPL